MLYKNLVLTGGNSKIGKSIIKLALNNNFKIFFSYYKGKKKAEMINRLYKNKKSISFEKLDLNNKNSIKNFFLKAKKKLIKIDLFINCASITVKKKSFLKSNIKDFEKSTTAYNGLLVALKNQINIINNQNLKYPSKIINFSSRIAFSGGNKLSHYAPMKAAINLITLILAKENSNKKIIFNTICPGKVIKNYNFINKKNKKKHKFVTPLILAKKCMSIYFNKNKSISGKNFLLDYH